MERRRTTPHIRNSPTALSNKNRQKKNRKGSVTFTGTSGTRLCRAKCSVLHPVNAVGKIGMIFLTAGVVLHDRKGRVNLTPISSEIIGTNASVTVCVPTYSRLIIICTGAFGTIRFLFLSAFLSSPILKSSFPDRAGKSLEMSPPCQSDTINPRCLILSVML